MACEDISKVATEHGAGVKPANPEEATGIPETKEEILEEFQRILSNLPKEAEIPSGPRSLDEEIKEIFKKGMERMDAYKRALFLTSAYHKILLDEVTQKTNALRDALDKAYYGTTE